MIEVVIVGFGFSAVPLVRELVASGTPFTIISSDFASIWDELSNSQRLDFDLVSSRLTSFYSFELAESFEHDGYPTAREFFASHRKWRAFYADRILPDEVVRVDVFADHSFIQTRSGRQLEAHHVVFATGFARAITSSLKMLDYDAPLRTALFDTMGDSANLIMARLIPNDVKIIIRTNGFHARDKVVPLFGTTYTLDQLEFHNYRYVSHDHYASIIYGAPLGSSNPYLLGDYFPLSVRDESFNQSRSRPVNGAVAIKYWPVDQYETIFAATLEQSLKDGYLLNDIAMWLHTGRAILVPKDTPVDFDKKTINIGGIERSFDLYISGDAETPRLPQILIEGKTRYEYLQRETFMGVMPRELPNVYLIGYTRPYTGGLANIIEMQGLFVHKSITQPAFHELISENLAERIEAYNHHYYGYDGVRRYEHLVYYGFYTDEMARLMGIEHRPDECETLADLLFYYAFPNNAFKYRLRGEYAVEGVRDLIRKVQRQSNRFISSLAYILASAQLDGDERREWLTQTSRNFFNDMRLKDAYRPFLDTYLQTYRRLHDKDLVSSPDPQWELLVASTSAKRANVVSRVSSKPPYRMDEEVGREIELIISWLAEGPKAKLKDLKMDATHAALIEAMRQPPEYSLPYLSN